ncbi:MAG: LamG domain-containing protein, partial [Chloroflexi bacterium]|nr:LamG domain-containing protein [Chloroflexota bacterium]
MDAEQIRALNAVAVWQFDEGHDATVHDTGSYYFDGQVEGAQWTNGLVGQALDFDGKNDRVVFDEGIPIDGEMTVSAWVRPELAPTGIGRLIAGTYANNGGGINRRGWYLGNSYGDVDQIRFLVNDQNGSQAYALYNGFFDQYLNQWVHVAGVFKPGQAVELYINGQLVDSDTTDVPAAIGDSGIFRIGARADNY